MPIRNVQEEDFEKLAGLLKSFFKIHNRFQQPKEDIIAYLKEQSQENDLIVDRYTPLLAAEMTINTKNSAVKLRINRDTSYSTALRWGF